MILNIKKRLNQHGFAHDLVIIAIVVVFAIAGAGYLVASHAASCNPVSGSTSAATSNGCAASGPVSSSQYAANCTINNIPSSIAIGATLTPTITITNVGTKSISPHMISYTTISNGPTTYFSEISFGAIPHGKSKTKSLPGYTIPANSLIGTNNLEVGTHSDLNFKASKVYFSCYSQLVSIVK